MEVDVLRKHFQDSGVHQEYSENLRSAFNGELPHAFDMVLALEKALYQGA